MEMTRERMEMKLMHDARAHKLWKRAPFPLPSRTDMRERSAEKGRGIGNTETDPEWTTLGAKKQTNHSRARTEDGMRREMETK
ncbi:hypothetical protein PRIPAC_84274 [Pristionchus pacificus]|uniref:Uncharacterized protein n=1 Tax=Pristionchus pacificus TaxID=54126 RepID=A0A2A6BKT9_PRIPA|nr:hypothetical protein PRIPAC_84274 [Pristionchus pacificus]|eukprot:PDM66534.1 hypothetical protein PRIPAC_47951 [Pristionchus pacificus]